MEHGTLWGHGAYLGPDYSAEYLHRLAEICDDPHAGDGRGRTEHALKQNRYDPATEPSSSARARRPPSRSQQREWDEYFRGPTPPPGLPPSFIKDPAEVEGPDRLLRLGGLGHGRQPTREGLLVHEQLALRAAGRQPAEQLDLSLERPQPDHPPGRHRRDPLLLRQVRLPRLEGRRRRRPTSTTAPSPAGS